MISSTLCLLFYLFVSTFSEIPYIQSTCGLNGSVKIYETILPSDRVDDEQIFFLEKEGSNSTEVIFLRTMDGKVMKSIDEGQTWEEQTVPQKMLNIQEYQILRMFPATTANEIVVYFLSNRGDGTFWVTNDGGLTYTYFNTLPHNTYDLLPHPKNPALMCLAICESKNNYDKREVWVGAHIKWDKLVDNLPPYTLVTWTPFTNTNPNRIYVLKDSGISGVFDGKIVYSDDFFKTSHYVNGISGVYRWSIFPPNRFVVSTCVTENSACDTKELHISDDGCVTFTTAIFPDYRKDTPNGQDFFVFELEDNTIWAEISRECSDSFCWGDMFHANSAAQKFTLSLQHLRRQDFTKFNSVDGIYVANQFATPGRFPKLGDPVRTLITYNKGSEWQIIKAPELDANSQPNECRLEDKCSLHIHGWETRDNFFTYFYSVPNAIGIMVATGNVGYRLNEDDPSSVNTYISYNGGVDWKELQKGPWVPEIGDHGSIITMVKQAEDTNSLIYTINGGVEWPTCQFTVEPMDVVNIRISEGWDSRRFLVYGSRTTNGVTRAVLVHLNFDDAFSGKCTYPDDYESWSPTDEHAHCVMGSKTIFMRRKKGVNCYFGEDHEHITTEKNCTCTIDDYECDHCFYRPDLSSPCTLECLVPGLPEEPDYCVNSTHDNPLYYYTDMGYRFVYGDSCDNSNNAVKPQGRIPCKFGEDVISPTPPTDDSLHRGLIESILLIALFVVGALGLSSIIFGILWKTNETFQSFIKYQLGWDRQPYDTVAIANEDDVSDDHIELDSDE